MLRERLTSDLVEHVQRTLYIARGRIRHSIPRTPVGRYCGFLLATTFC